jgi:hypothetical protein
MDAGLWYAMMISLLAAVLNQQLTRRQVVR